MKVFSSHLTGFELVSEDCLKTTIDEVKIVGMRFHPGSINYIESIRRKPTFNQRLFLLPDTRNNFDENAIMLHNGDMILGYVSADECGNFKKIFDDLNNDGKNYVIVCSYDDNMNIHLPRKLQEGGMYFMRLNPLYVSTERRARKAAEYLKEK